MATRTRMFIAGIATLACLPWSASAVAEDGPVVTPASPAVMAPRVNPFGVVPLDSQVLATQRGGADTWNDMKLNGVVANNQAVNVSTGSNLMTDGALSGAAGVPMVIQNSGNNVLIQNATIVNVQMK